MSVVRIATRGSDLALAQARWVAGRLRDDLGLESELVIIKTTGDRIQNIPLAEVGGKGLFVKEIEEALLERRADLAVHSGKDLPASLAEGLILAGFPERVDPRDALVSQKKGMSLDTLPEGARVGTGSSRRKALLLHRRPDLEVVPMRGNVPTRIAKLESESLDAVVLACAGLERLGMADRIAERIAEDDMLPAVCQGTLALETRADDPLAESVARLNDPGAALSQTGERAFLLRIGGDCTVPIAVHLEAHATGRIRIRGLVASLDGRRLAEAEEIAPASEAAAAGERVADEVLARGGRKILDELRADD